jgi:hypothetical protein
MHANRYEKSLENKDTFELMLFVNAKYCDCKSGIIKKDKGVHSDGG